MSSLASSASTIMSTTTMAAPGAQAHRMLRHGWMDHINVCSAFSLQKEEICTSSSSYTLLAGASPHLALLKKASES